MTSDSKGQKNVASTPNGTITWKGSLLFLLYTDLHLLSDRIAAICSIFYNRMRVN